MSNCTSILCFSSCASDMRCCLARSGTACVSLAGIVQRHGLYISGRNCYLMWLMFVNIFPWLFQSRRYVICTTMKVMFNALWYRRYTTLFSLRPVLCFHKWDYLGCIMLKLYHLYKMFNAIVLFKSHAYQSFVKKYVILCKKIFSVINKFLGTHGFLFHQKSETKGAT